MKFETIYIKMKYEYFKRKVKFEFNFIDLDNNYFFQLVHQNVGLVHNWVSINSNKQICFSFILPFGAFQKIKKFQLQ